MQSASSVLNGPGQLRGAGCQRQRSITERGVVADLTAGQTQDTPHDIHPVGGVADDEQDAVVAGDRAEYLGPVLHVEGLGDGVGSACQRLHDDQVADPLRADEQMWKQTVQSR